MNAEQVFFGMGGMLTCGLMLYYTIGLLTRYLKPSQTQRYINLNQRYAIKSLQILAFGTILYGIAMAIGGLTLFYANPLLADVLRSGTIVFALATAYFLHKVNGLAAAPR